MAARPAEPTGPTGSTGSTGSTDSTGSTEPADRPAPGRAERRRLPLATAPGAVARSREFTRSALRAWGWLPGADDRTRTAAEDVLLMTSELVTNACQHAAGPYTLELTRYGPLLRVEVRDADDRPPTLRLRREPARPGGHGLLVVDRLSAAWGSEPVEGGGKTVWLEIVRPPAEP
ncbi:ATP-binding protein [Kitasatospora sp. NRRL B-11411]|uniref:ATP-binding protein n=1 Tax=Kitasatospora sp. NRRL B-11411 TaxID=1463822 RepID=UPI0018E339F1|nr:ATP-binding protein [Kitasatospora sp. NRRL B-11411]